MQPRRPLGNYGSPHYPNLCTSLNHGTDFDPATTGDTGLSAWAQYYGAGTTPFSPGTMGLDYYNFMNFNRWPTGGTDPGIFYQYGVGYVVISTYTP